MFAVWGIPAMFLHWYMHRQHCHWVVVWTCMCRVGLIGAAGQLAPHGMEQTRCCVSRAACCPGLQHTEAAASPSRLLGGRGAAASPFAITGMGPHSAAGDACSSDSQPEQWTHVRHNDLFVPLPSETAAATAGTGAAAAEQQQGQQLAVLRPASPGGWAGEGSTDLALMPGSVDATASPTAQLAAAIDQRQVQDAVLQLVLGIGLQELHSGGLQVSLQLATMFGLLADAFERQSAV